MPETDPDRIALDAFSLAVRVMLHAFAIEAPAAALERPWALLREIADGQTTLANPAEMAARFPQMKDFIYESANQVVEHDREVAHRVLRGLAGAS